MNRFTKLLDEILDLLIQLHLPVICWNAPEPRIGYSQTAGTAIAGNSDYRLRRGSGSAKMKERGSSFRVMVGPGCLQTVSEFLHRLIALTVPDHQTRYRATDRSAIQNIVFIVFDISFTGAWMSSVRNSFRDR